jgi:hypothetical protein
MSISYTRAALRSLEAIRRPGIAIKMLFFGKEKHFGCKESRYAGPLRGDIGQRLDPLFLVELKSQHIHRHDPIISQQS